MLSEGKEKSEVCVYDLKTLCKVKTMVYTLPAKEALIAAAEQVNGNFDTWKYPKDMKGIRESVKPGRWVFSGKDLAFSSEPARERRIA